MMQHAHLATYHTHANHTDSVHQPSMRWRMNAHVNTNGTNWCQVSIDPPTLMLVPGLVYNTVRGRWRAPHAYVFTNGHTRVVLL